MGTIPNVELPAGFTSITTIKVITPRHSEACQKKHRDRERGWGPNDNNCNCCKHIYIYENGKDRTYSAKTRNLETATELVREEWDKRDPVKQKLREIEEREKAKAAAEEEAKAAKNMTIEEAADRWRKAMKPKTKSTAKIHRGVANRIKNWAKANGIEFVAGLTFDLLDKWRGEWSLGAEQPYNRIGQNSQCKLLRYLRNFCRYIVDLGYLDKDPSANLASIQEKINPGIPLTPQEYEELLATIEPFCAEQTGIVHGMAKEIRSEFQLQRWAGLRIGDAIAFSRSGLAGNRISLTTQKTGALIDKMVIPDDVAAELAALPADRPGFRAGHFFWVEGRNSVDSLEPFWTHEIIAPLNAYLHWTDKEGNPKRFHSHMLRDTFAVELLLQGVSLEAVSKLLTHESIKVTSTYYAPWVESRRKKLEKDLVASMRAMGVKVTL